MRRSSSRSGAIPSWPLDDCLYHALQATIPHLTRSSLHRCLQRHGISRLPEVEGDKAAKKKFQVLRDRLLSRRHRRSQDQRRASSICSSTHRTRTLETFAFVQLHEQADRRTAIAFLEALIAATPYRLHTILTDNGIQFADLPLQPRRLDGALSGAPCFDQICREHGIEHRLTKPNHPWTNGQVERMNRNH